MNIAIRSALIRSSHDLHGVFDVTPLAGFFGVALVRASFGIVGRLGDSVKAVLLDHLPRDRVDLYLGYHVALLMFSHAGNRRDRCLSGHCGPIQMPLNWKFRSSRRRTILRLSCKKRRAAYEILFDEWRNNAAANWTQFTDCPRTMPWRGQQW